MAVHFAHCRHSGSQLLLVILLALAFNAQALAAWSMPVMPSTGSKHVSVPAAKSSSMSPCHGQMAVAGNAMKHMPAPPTDEPLVQLDHCDTQHDCQSDCPHCNGLCSSAMATAMPLSSNWPGKRMSPLFHSQAMPKGALASLYRPPIL
jgi:hypothetical protein